MYEGLEGQYGSFVVVRERPRDQNLEMAASYHKNCPAIHGAARNWPIREASIRAVKRVISG